jgi:hypothetical protein
VQIGIEWIFGDTVSAMFLKVKMLLNYIKIQKIFITKPIKTCLT